MFIFNPYSTSIQNQSCHQIQSSRLHTNLKYSLASHYISRRCMVYVHSNLLIVDDEYLLLGTGSISQKSLSGKRDTELSIGAWQPKHTQVHKTKI